MYNNNVNIHQFTTEFPELLKQFKKKYEIPLIIEVSGTPNSGKTSVINMLRNNLRRCHIPHSVIYESANKCKINDKLSENFNIWTTCNTICSLIEKTESNKDVIICERGIFDALFWCNFHYSRNNLDDNEKKIFENVLSLGRFTDLISILFIFKCSAEASIRREGLLLTHTEGRIVNKSVINQLNSSIDITRQNYGSVFKKTIEIDTSELEQLELQYSFIEKLVNICKEL